MIGDHSLWLVLRRRGRLSAGNHSLGRIATPVGAQPGEVAFWRKAGGPFREVTLCLQGKLPLATVAAADATPVTPLPASRRSPKGETMILGSASRGSPKGETMAFPRLL